MDRGAIPSASERSGAAAEAAAEGAPSSTSADTTGETGASFTPTSLFSKPLFSSLSTPDTSSPSSLLSSALSRRDWDSVRKLVKSNPELLTSSDGGLSPLHRCALSGDADAITALLSAGASADARDAAGATPLHLAAAKGQLKAVRALLAAGARPVRNALGKTPLHDAAWAGHMEVVAELVKAGADVNARGKDGRAAIHCASLSEKQGMVNELLDAGAWVNVVDGEGRTPLDWARTFERASGKSSVAETLQQAGAVAAEDLTTGFDETERTFRVGARERERKRLSFEKVTVRKKDADMAPPEMEAKGRDDLALHMPPMGQAVGKDGRPASAPPPPPSS